MLSKIHLSTFSLIILLGACGDDGATSASAATEATSDATDGTTDATGDASTTEEVPTTGQEPGTGSTTVDHSTTHDDTGDLTTGDSTTGEVDPDIVEACAAYCGRWGECGFQPDLAGCIAGCSEGSIGASGACNQATQAELACKTALGCDELFEAVGDQEGGGPCSEEVDAVAAACAADECGQSLGNSDDECELSFDCPNAPLQEMKCDAATCTCLEGGEEVGQCAAEGVCLQGDEIFAKAASCCGF